MAEGGDVQKIILQLIEDNPDKTPVIVPKAETSVEDCCFQLPLFGDIADTDKFKNDRTGYLKRYGKSVTAVTFTLQKCINDTFVDAVDLVDNTYGTFHTFGFFESQGFKYIGIYMDWRQVLIDPDTNDPPLGKGTYRILTKETNILASLPVQNQCSFEYDLNAFTADAANETVRFDTTTSGILGDPNDQKSTFAFPVNWLDGIRLPGRFGNNNGTYEQRFTVYNNRRKIRLQDDLARKYLWQSDRIRAFAHDYMQINILMATIVLATDYNTNNANEIAEFQVIKEGEYNPNWDANSKLASVEVEFVDAYDNIRGRYCN